MLPKIETYGHYKDNYGMNALKINLGTIEFYYSYDTIIAFKDDEGFLISENVWTVTTGKHLNWIEPDKSVRIPFEEYSKLLDKAIRRHIK